MVDLDLFPIRHLDGVEPDLAQPRPLVALVEDLIGVLDLEDLAVLGQRLDDVERAMREFG
jgi:hypothetical protein